MKHAAIFEWTWTLFVLLLRTGVITTIILLAAMIGIRFCRGASAAVRHRIWFAAVLGCLAVPCVMVFVPLRKFSLASPAAKTPPPTAIPEKLTRTPAVVEVVESSGNISESPAGAANRKCRPSEIPTLPKLRTNSFPVPLPA